MPTPSCPHPLNTFQACSYQNCTVLHSHCRQYCVLPNHPHFGENFLHETESSKTCSCSGSWRNSMHFTKPEVLLPYSQTSPLTLVLSQINPILTPPPPNPSSLRSVIILYSYQCLGLSSGLFRQTSHQSHVYVFHPISATCLLISTSLVWPSEYHLAWNTYHEAPHYAVFSSLLLPSCRCAQIFF